MLLDLALLLDLASHDYRAVNDPNTSAESALFLSKK
jgi:hypothetical protein